MGYRMIFKVDGACKRNGLPNAVGGCGVVRIHRFGGMKKYRQGLESDRYTATNQRAELWALKFALEIALEKRESLVNDPFLDVRIESDSMYAVKCLTEWNVKWRNNGWRNVRGTPVANRDLIQEIEELCDIIEEDYGRVQFSWICREHNHYADELAKMACEEQEY